MVECCFICSIHILLCYIYTHKHGAFLCTMWGKNGDGELVLMFLNKKWKKLKLLVHRMSKSENFMV